MSDDYDGPDYRHYFEAADRDARYDHLFEAAVADLRLAAAFGFSSLAAVAALGVAMAWWWLP